MVLGAYLALAAPRNQAAQPAAGRRTSALESAVVLQLQRTSSLAQEEEAAVALAKEQQSLREAAAVACKAPDQPAYGKTQQRPVEVREAGPTVAAIVEEATKPETALGAEASVGRRAAAQAGHTAHALGGPPSGDPQGYRSDPRIEEAPAEPGEPPQSFAQGCTGSRTEATVSATLTSMQSPLLISEVGSAR